MNHGLWDASWRRRTWVPGLLHIAADLRMGLPGASSPTRDVGTAVDVSSIEDYVNRTCSEKQCLDANALGSRSHLLRDFSLTLSFSFCRMGIIRQASGSDAIPLCPAHNKRSVNVSHFGCHCRDGCSASSRCHVLNVCVRPKHTTKAPPPPPQRDGIKRLGSLSSQGQERACFLAWLSATWGNKKVASTTQERDLTRT